jgi:hypothetical protein
LCGADVEAYLALLLNNTTPAALAVIYDIVAIITSQLRIV